MIYILIGWLFILDSSLLCDSSTSIKSLLLFSSVYLSRSSFVSFSICSFLCHFALLLNLLLQLLLQHPQIAPFICQAQCTRIHIQVISFFTYEDESLNSVWNIIDDSGTNGVYESLLILGCLFLIFAVLAVP